MRKQRTSALAVTAAQFLLVLVAALFLTSCGSPEDDQIANLISRLDSETTDHQAEYEILAQGEKAVPQLIKALNSPSANIRIHSACLLGELHSSAAIQPLITASRRGDRPAHYALRALGKIGGPESAARLIEALDNESNCSHQIDIVMLLGPIGDNRAVDSLARILRNTELESSLRAHAADALAHFRDPRARSALEDAVDKDPDWRVYRAAKKALSAQTTGFKNDYSQLACLHTAVGMMPEPPEGAEEYVRRSRESAGPHRQSMGPDVLSFTSEEHICRSREWVVRHLRAGGQQSVELLETLIERYLGGGKIPAERKKNASDLVVAAGPCAIPTLQNAMHRGDKRLHQDCMRCLQEIEKNAAIKR